MAASLSTYQAKRNFAKTAEPSDAIAVAPSQRLRFVVQKHDATRLHYDLRLELDGVFKSWAVTRGPSRDPADKRLAVEVEDHPLAYGDFEGTIPAGEYGGGTVQLWDRGYWEPDGPATPAAMLAGGDLKFVLHGERLHGSWVLVRMKTDRRGNGKRTNWLLIKHRDTAAREGDEDALLADDRSVASGRAMAAIAAGRGKAPAPFMAAKAAMTPDAVWNSSTGVAAEARAADPAPGRTRASQAKPAGQAAKAAPPAAKSAAKSAAATPSAASKHKPGSKPASLPAFIPPQLCEIVERPPSGAEWVHEIKFDGYRMQLRVAGGAATLKTRTGLDWSDRFPALIKAARALPDVIIDSEVVALDEHGAPDFAALQAALSDKQTDELIAYAFDCLAIAGEDLCPLPLAVRKERLRALLAEADIPLLRHVEHFSTGGEAILKSACRLSLEGIVSKRLDAPYVSGRGGAWTKAKCRAGHEVVIGGWTTTGEAFRSLLVGARRGNHLVYLGRVGTGFGASKVATLLPHLKAHAAKSSPFSGVNAPKGGSDIHWLHPDLVAEIEFAGWTGDGMVRQGAFEALREDKPAAEVEAETPAVAASVDVPPADARVEPPKRKPSPAKKPAAKSTPVPATGRYAAGRTGEGRATVMGVAISHPDKALWPEAGDDGKPVTKHDLARYFETVAAWMLPHLLHRPCSIVRAPDGFAGEQFFQRHAMANGSNLLELMHVSGDRKPYLAIGRPEALAALAQVAALELHPSNCQSGAPDKPGRLVFDLDPGPDVPFATVVEAAIAFRDRLATLGLESFLKTTGGKGLHVVTPLAVPKSGGPTWADAKVFARDVCAGIAKDNPARYVTVMAKKLRQGRIYLDYLRNDALSTAVAPLSPRARPGATVSMPIIWAEATPRLDPARYTVRTVPSLLAKTKAWAEYEAARKPLAAAIKRLAKG